MFNFQNLSPTDFEVLSKDIIEFITKEPFRTYPPGPDGGIDFRHATNEKIFGQVKHYIESDKSILVSKLKKELAKVEKKSPDEYYIFTSKRLGEDYIKKLYEHFKEYMPSEEYIYDAEVINNLLQKPEYKPIVLKHYKLWLTSSNILTQINNNEIFIGTEIFLDDIDEKKNLFVQTKAYSKAINILEEYGLLFITGNPGVGKTTLSQMLVLKYADKGYVIKHSKDDSLDKIMEAIAFEKDSNVLIILDDFLGSHYMNINNGTPNKITTLIAYVKKYSNMKLILNSRIIILNEAKQQYKSLDKTLNKNRASKYTLVADKITTREKKHILNNHIYFSNIPREFKQQFYRKNLASLIINHKNFTPRLVEHITSENFIDDISSNDYDDEIDRILDNPTEVWDREFDIGLQKTDRDFMICLYSFNRNSIKLDYLRECFNQWIIAENHDATCKPFDRSLARVNNSMIKLSSLRNAKEIRVSNPSMNDFLMNRLKNKALFEKVLNNSISYDQLNRLRIINKDLVAKHVERLATNGKLLELNTYYYNKQLEFLRLFNYSHLLHDYLEVDLKRVLISESLFSEMKNRRLSSIASVIINIITDAKYYRFYNLFEIIINGPLLEQLVRSSDIEDITKLFTFIYDLEVNSLVSSKDNLFRTKWLTHCIEMYAHDAIFDQVKDEFESDVMSTAEDEVESYIIKDAVIEYDDIDVLKYEALDYTKDEVISNYDSDIESSIDDLIKPLKKYNPSLLISVDSDDIFSDINLEFEIESLIDNEVDRIKREIENEKI